MTAANAVSRIGFHMPDDAPDENAEPVMTEFRYYAESDYVQATFNVWEASGGSALIGWYLEDVGLVTWHRAPSLDVAIEWVYEQTALRIEVPE